MKVIGRPEEIEWVKQALQNNCENCPYEPVCNAAAEKEQEKYGKVHQSCYGFISHKIKFVIAKD